MKQTPNHSPLTAEQLRAKLNRLTEEIIEDFSGLDPACSKALLSDFVSDLLLSAADQRRREDHRRKQAEGIAAARARGVKFGRPGPPLPENFDETRRAWRKGELTLRQAATACGMPQSSFYDAVMRLEQPGQRIG